MIRFLFIVCVLLGATPLAQAQALTLERAIELALENNERSQIADEQRNAVEAGVTRARAAFLPRLSVVGTYRRRPYETIRNGVTVQKFDGLNASARATLDLINPGAFPLYRRARLLADAAELTAREDKRSLSFDVADSYLNALAAEQVAMAANNRLQFANESLLDAQARLKAGIASSNDVTRAELELASAQRELTRAQSDMQVLRTTLGNLIGASLPAELELPGGVIEAPATADATELIAQASRVRQDLQAQRLTAHAARVFALEPILRWLPSIALFGELRVTNEAGFTARSIDSAAGLELTWALFDGGVRIADRAERDALAKIGTLNVSATERGLSLNVQAALLEMNNGEAAVRQATVASEAATKNAQETRELYRQGLARALDLANASSSLFEAEVQLTRERYGRGLALLNLRAALGQDPLGKEPSP